MNDLFLEVNPIPVKAALNLMGLDAGPYAAAPVRDEPGGTPPTLLRATLREAGLL